MISQRRCILGTACLSPQSNWRSSLFISQSHPHLCILPTAQTWFDARLVLSLYHLSFNRRHSVSSSHLLALTTASATTTSTSHHRFRRLLPISRCLSSLARRREWTRPLLAVQQGCCHTWSKRSRPTTPALDFLFKKQRTHHVASSSSSSSTNEPGRP